MWLPENYNYQLPGIIIDPHDCVAQKLDPLGAERGPQAKVVVATMEEIKREEMEEEMDILLLFLKVPPHWIRSQLRAGAFHICSPFF